jgi:hypothetical protein
MSHSVPIASTSARNFWSSPRRFTFTCACDAGLQKVVPE